MSNILNTVSNRIIKLKRGKGRGTIAHKRIAEATEKRHADVIRDIQVLIEKKAIDLIINFSSNLSSIQDEPICFKFSSQDRTDKTYHNTFSMNLLIRFTQELVSALNKNRCPFCADSVQSIVLEKSQKYTFFKGLWFQNIPHPVFYIYINPRQSFLIG